MSPRAALLAATSALGLLLARGLDGLGLLPGVTEPESVRHAALDPRWTALGLLACVGVGVLAGRLMLRSPLLALAALVLGQVGVVVALEEAARELSGAPEPAGGETGLWIATGVQLVLAVVAVTTALLVLRLVVPGLDAAMRLLDHAALLPSYRVVLVRVTHGATWGRAPPQAA